jgi:hypothetical protein
MFAWRNYLDAATFEKIAFVLGNDNPHKVAGKDVIYKTNLVLNTSDTFASEGQGRDLGFDGRRGTMGRVVFQLLQKSYDDLWIQDPKGINAAAIMGHDDLLYAFSHIF